MTSYNFFECACEIITRCKARIPRASKKIIVCIVLPHTQSLPILSRITWQVDSSSAGFENPAFS